MCFGHLLYNIGCFVDSAASYGLWARVNRWTIVLGSTLILNHENYEFLRAIM